MTTECPREDLIDRINQLLFNAMKGKGPYSPQLILVSLAIIQNAVKPVGQHWRVARVASLPVDDILGRLRVVRMICECKDIPPDTSKVDYDNAEIYVAQMILTKAEIQPNKCLVVEVLNAYDFQDCGTILGCHSVVGDKIWRHQWERQSETVDFSRMFPGYSVNSGDTILKTAGGSDESGSGE
jgi:hypothetical protein